MIALVAATLAAAPPPAPAALSVAADTSYYFSTGADCSDSYAGTSPARALCTPALIARARLRPGDRVLFACGGTWRQPSGAGDHPFLALRGSGTARRPIEVGAYDSTSGARSSCTRKPHLIGAAGDAQLITVTNGDHWIVSDLELSHGSVGLRFHFDTAGHRSITVRELVVHDFKGIYRGDCNAWPKVYTALGVLFDHSGTLLPRDDRTILTGVTVSGLEGYHNQGSLGLSGYGCSAVSARSYLYRNIELRDLHLHDDDGPGPACSDGLQLVAAAHVRIIDSRFEREGACTTTSGTTGVILGQLHDVTFINDVFAHTPDTDSPDQTGIDFENFTDGVRVLGSYLGRNAGPGVEVLTINGARNFHTNLRIADNVFDSNSTRPFASTGEGGHIWRGGTGPQPTGSITGNLYSRGTALVVGHLPKVAVSANRPISTATHAAVDFGEQAWAASISTDGRRWTPLRRTGAGFIDRFGMLRVAPFTLDTTSCARCAVARTWTASRSGTVDIRGIVTHLGEHGDRSAVAQVDLGARTLLRLAVAPASSASRTGIDHVHVKRGDTLRFVVSATRGAVLSWAPIVAFTD